MLSLLILLINRIQCPGILGLCSLQCAQQDAGECNEAQCRLGLHLHTQPILLHGDVHQRFLVWSITCVQGNHQRRRRHVRLLGLLCCDKQPAPVHLPAHHPRERQICHRRSHDFHATYLVRMSPLALTSFVWCFWLMCLSASLRFGLMLLSVLFC